MTLTKDDKISYGIPNNNKLGERIPSSEYIDVIACSKVADELNITLTQLAQYQLAFQVDDFTDYNYQLQKAKIEAIYKTVVELQQTMRGNGK